METRMKMSQPVHACYELLGSFWITVPQGFSERLGILVCSGNYNSPSCMGCIRNQGHSLTVSWGRSENKGEIQELVVTLSSNMSCCVVWLLEAYLKDGHSGSCGLHIYKACLLQGRILFFHEHCLFACTEAQCLVGDFELWHCDPEGSSELMTDLSCVFYHSHPMSCKLVNEHKYFFSAIEPPYSYISRHMYTLNNQKDKDRYS